jgi:hypothetical protein
VPEYKVVETYGQNGGKAPGFVVFHGKWWRYTPSKSDIAIISVQDELYLRGQLSKIISSLHSMMEPDPVSETLCIPNIPETLEEPG